MSSSGLSYLTCGRTSGQRLIYVIRDLSMTSLSKLGNKPRCLLPSAHSTRPDFPIHKMGHVISDPRGGEDDRHMGRVLPDTPF